MTANGAALKEEAEELERVVVKKQERLRADGLRDSGCLFRFRSEIIITRFAVAAGKGDVLGGGGNSLFMCKEGNVIIAAG